MRCTTCRTLVSCPGVPGRPALRKYLLTTMSVASWDHAAGTSTSSIWKTIEPSGFAMTVRRRSQAISSSGWTPGRVKRRGTRSPAWVGGASAAAASGAEPAPPVSVWVMGTSLVLLATEEPFQMIGPRWRGVGAQRASAARFAATLASRPREAGEAAGLLRDWKVALRSHARSHSLRAVQCLIPPPHAPRARAKFAAQDAVAMRAPCFRAGTTGSWRGVPARDAGRESGSRGARDARRDGYGRRTEGWMSAPVLASCGGLISTLPARL